MRHIKMFSPISEIKVTTHEKRYTFLYTRVLTHQNIENLKEAYKY